MINVREILSGPPAQKGSMMIFAGLVLLFTGVMALKVLNQNGFWALIALGAVLGMRGGIALASLPSK